MCVCLLILFVFISLVGSPLGGGGAVGSGAAPVKPSAGSPLGASKRDVSCHGVG